MSTVNLYRSHLPSLIPPVFPQQPLLQLMTPHTKTTNKQTK